jgi:hypothetical protein
MSKFDKIFELYEKYGNIGYLGENVSQIEHALQCARLAENHGFDHYVILVSYKKCIMYNVTNVFRNNLFILILNFKNCWGLYFMILAI